MLKKTQTALMAALVFCATAAAFASGKKDAADAASKTAPAAPEAASPTTTAPAKTEGATLRIGVLNGPTGIPVAYLCENAPELPGATASFEVFAEASAELPKLIKGEIDIGVLPANAAAKVFTANNGALVALGIAGNGNLFLLTHKSGFSSLESLKGSSVTCAGSGATPEYMFRYVLTKHGLTVGEGADAVALDFSVPNADIAALLIAHKIDYALLPEPFASVAEMKGEGISRVCNLQDEYASLSGNATYPITLLVANAKFAAANKELINAYIEAYKASVAWTKENPNKAGVLVQKHTLGLMAPIAAHAIPNGGYTWVDAQDARPQIEALLSIFLDSQPASVGGALPGDSFYYTK